MAGLGLSCGCLERGAEETGRTVEVVLVVYCVLLPDITGTLTVTGAEEGGADKI